jgi:hypothetical protein
MHLSSYLGLLETGSDTLAASYRQVARGHAAETDVFHTCLRFADQCDEHHARLGPIVHRYGSHQEGEPERLHADGLSETRAGGIGLLRDLHDLYLLASYLDLAWTVVQQAGKGSRDADLIEVVQVCADEITNQLAWLRTRTKSAAPQALLVAD